MFYYSRFLLKSIAKYAFILLLFLSYNQGLYAQTIKSPDKNLSLTFKVNDNGIPLYQLEYKGKSVIKESKLGIEVKDQPSFMEGFEIDKTNQITVDNSWEPLMGEQKTIINNYTELLVILKQPQHKNRQLKIRFRLFNDGLGFRYEFPKQPNLNYFIIDEEHTEFQLTGNHKIFWIPGDYDTNEYAYTTSKIAEIPKLMEKATAFISAQQPIKNLAIQTPSMMKTDGGLYINIHEAALINYPAMSLNVDAVNFKMSSHLTPDAVGNKGYMQTNTQSPWRTIVVSDKATDVLASKLILNLNEPTKYKDVSWIKPMKYIGVWWEYFVAGKSTWAYGTETNVKLDQDFSKLTPNEKHGATNKRVSAYIDFASKHGFDAVLVEEYWLGRLDW